jgi:hypothetical protein
LLADVDQALPVAGARGSGRLLAKGGGGESDGQHDGARGHTARESLLHGETP